MIWNYILWEKKVWTSSSVNDIDVWNSYFPDVTPTQSHTSNYQFFSTSTGSYFVHQNEFYSLSQAIYITAQNENSKLLVYRSSFTSCYCSSQGASIYHYGGSFILFQSCGTKSKNDVNDGTFLFSYSFQIINLPQFLIESTISECGETGKG